MHAAVKTTAESATVSFPIPLRRPTVMLTDRGYAVLALIHEQDALDATDTAGRDRLERAISELLDS